MRVLFAGTPELAVPSLRAVHEVSEVCAVLTAPDRASGRGRRLTASPVKQLAEQLGHPVLQPERLNGEARRQVAIYAPELLICVAYGKIFGPKFLGLFPRGGINLHPSLLPRHRGPAPIPAAILAGDSETGVTIQSLSERMDAGDIYLQSHRPLDGSETTEQLSAELAESGAELLAETVRRIDAGTVTAKPQDENKATYCGMIAKTDGRIDWNSPAEKIERMVRAYAPWPSAYTYLNGVELKILAATVRSADRAEHLGQAVGGAPEPGTVLGVDRELGILVQTGDGVLGILRLQQKSRKPAEWRTFLNGNPAILESVLGGTEQ